MDGKEKKEEGRRMNQRKVFADSHALEVKILRLLGGKKKESLHFDEKKKKSDGRDGAGAPLASSIRPALDTQESNTVSMPLSCSESRQ